MTTKSIIWEWGQPRVIQGYWDMGGIQIPPLPRQIVLTDRADGITQYLLQFDKVGSFIQTNTVIPTSGKFNPSPDTQVYAANEEPYLTPGVRLAISNGLLILDISGPVGTVTDQEQGQLFLRGLPQQVAQLILAAGNFLGYQMLVLP